MWTDVIQGAVMIVSVCIICVMSIQKVGGFDEIFRAGVEGKRIEPIEYIIL